MTPVKIDMLEQAIDEVENLLSRPSVNASEVKARKKAAQQVISKINEYNIGHILDRAEGYWPKNPDWVRSEIGKARSEIWEMKRRG